jgi:hypothetical protein
VALSGGTLSNHRNLTGDSRSHGRDASWRSLDYKAEALPFDNKFRPLLRHNSSLIIRINRRYHENLKVRLARSLVCVELIGEETCCKKPELYRDLRE